MATPFGPQLIGETEKTLVALLRRFLDDTELTESQWVTLRVAGLLDGSAVDGEGLAAAVADRAHFTDAAELVKSLTLRGLIENGRLTDAGREVVAAVLAKSEAATGPIWKDLPADDVAATARVLNELLDRARAVLR
jgi:DNA-binding MarR family transcriptional regulator